jgi:two-component system nitrogen regulation response regulator GlnG
MSGKERILVAEDEQSMRWVLDKALSRAGYEVVQAADGMEALAQVDEKAPDAILMDIRMPGMDGLAVLKQVVGRFPDIQVIIMTAHGTMNTAIEAMKNGAYDYVTKPFDIDAVVRLIRKALEKQKLERQVHNLTNQLGSRYELGNIIGKTPAMQQVYKIIGRIADSDVNVLIRGESGTGKELVARAIHYNSSRAEKPFITVNSAALPAQLLESELFGHEKGAFTGAVSSRRGRFQMADGGTLFLDEIGDMDLDLQAKLLRVIQEQSFERVGGEVTYNVNVRMIFASNIDLTEAVKQGKFREDLYYRINVVPILLPPLRERVEDIGLLVDYFIDRFNKELKRKVVHVAPEAMDAMKRYGWPGNVRELENTLQRIMALSKDNSILFENLPSTLKSREKTEAGTADIPSQVDELKEIIDKALENDGGAYEAAIAPLEKRLLMAALERTDGNKLKAAALLGINRNTLRKKLTEHGLIK